MGVASYQLCTLSISLHVVEGLGSKATQLLILLAIAIIRLNPESSAEEIDTTSSWEGLQSHMGKVESKELETFSN